MTIRLSQDLEEFIHDAMRAGLYAGEEDLIRDALTRLKQSMPPTTNAPVGEHEVAKPARAMEPPLAPDELSRRLMAAGLVIELPDPAQDGDDADDLPIEIQGEPLSETIIRERR